MDRLETLEFLRKKYKLDYTKPSPHIFLCSRYDEALELFGELGLKRGAEIGVYRGGYSNDILTRLPGCEHLIGVDIWARYEDYLHQGVMPDLTTTAEATARAVFDSHGDRATLIKGYSTEVAKTIPNESLDFVFIDANHSYEYVVADIAAWLPKLRKGGIIYGHDYQDFSNQRLRWDYMHVVDAVNGWVRSYKVNPWFLMKRVNKKRRDTFCWMWVK
jgi:hypothetical protein